jgi:esterase/lipase superfamily enzyme
MVTARHVELWSDAIGASGGVVAYGHWGRPVLAFPAERGGPWEYEQRGMIAAVAGLIDAGRVKLYCVDSFDSASWSNAELPIEARAEQHGRYEAWILDSVAPWITADCGGAHEIAVTGVSLGAYHAVNFALKRADRFPLALGFSGNYDPASWNAWGERGSAAYFNNPMDYLVHMDGEHLAWLRGRVRILLVCWQGPWEGPPGALASQTCLGWLLGKRS